MTYTQKKDLLLEQIRNGTKMLGRDQVLLVVLLSVPSMLAQLTHIVMQYIDASMVGSLGKEASASIGLVSTTIWLFGSLSSAANVGFYVQVAHRIGAGEFAEARNVLRQSFISCILFAFTLMVIGVSISPYLPSWLGGNKDINANSTLYFMCYSLCLPFAQLNSLCSGMLRCSGNMHIPSILNIGMCFLDVIFNWFLIFPSHQVLGITIPGAGLGVMGAVIGTGLAFAVTSLLMCYFTTIASKELNLLQDKGSFIPKLDTLRKATKISLPIAVQHIIFCGAQITSTLIVAPLGTIAIAANSFGIIVEALCYMPGYGIADAATTLVGQSLGAKRRKLARSFGNITVSMGVAVMTVLGIVMYLTAPSLMTLMTPDVAVQHLTSLVLRIEAFAEPMFAASIVAYGVFVGAGDTLIPCAMNLGSIWVVRITLAILLSTTMGLQGVWIAMATELCFRGVIFLIRLRGDSWMKKIPLNA